MFNYTSIRIYLSDLQFDGFHLLLLQTVLYQAFVNAVLCTFVRISPGCYLRGRMVGLSSECIFHFSVQCQVVLPIYTLSRRVILYPCWLPDIFRLLNFANPTGGKWSLTVLLICVSLITSEIEYYYTFLGHLFVLCQMSLSFFIWCVFFFLLSYRHFSYILDILSWYIHYKCIFPYTECMSFCLSMHLSVKINL